MIVGLVISVAALLVAAALRAGLTSALGTPRADALRDAAEGMRGADRIARLLEDRDSIHPSVNALHTALLLTSAVPAAWILARRVDGPAVVASLVVLVLMMWLIGDYLPRGFGRARSRRVAYRLAPLLATTVRWGRAANEFVAEEGTALEADSFSSNGNGEEEEERELIDSVLEFTDTIVREVMVPRADMVTIDRHSGVATLAALTAEHGFSRYPLSDGPEGEVVGVVLTKDVLGAHAAGEEVTEIGKYARPVLFIPETKRASDLLREMQASKTHLALVVDEFGDISGLVSIEDLLEELVGEITDEHDTDEQLIRVNDDGSLVVDARTDVAELGDILSVDLPNDEWDTVGGLVLGMAGRVPEPGEEFIVNGLVFEVVRLQGRRVAEVIVRPSQTVATGD
ncbi:MAG: hemolysin family protein [Acidimicrobiia bacterium]